MKSVWILFSYISGWDESKHFHNIFWEEPNPLTLREYFTQKPKRTSDFLEGSYEKLLEGEITFLYGEHYWIERFNEPKTNKDENNNEEVGIDPPPPDTHINISDLIGTRKSI